MLTVGDIMPRKVVTVKLDDTLRRIREIFDECFFHHLVVVNDLQRGLLNNLLVRAGSGIVTRSWVVRKDAVLSIRAAFTREELHSMAADAGMDDATIRGGGGGRRHAAWRRGPTP